MDGGANFPVRGLRNWFSRQQDDIPTAFQAGQNRMEAGA
jgi:hypothetical protein